MRVQRLSLLLLPLVAAACGSPSQETALRLNFSPQAFTGGEYAESVTTFAGDDGCAVPDGITTFAIETFSRELTSTPRGTFTRGDLNDDCELVLLLPANATLDVVVVATNADDKVVRKGITPLDVGPEGEMKSETLPLWPATRIADDAAGDGSPDLEYVDVLRQFDRFVFDLVFADDALPATQQGEEAVYGELFLTAGETNYAVLLDASPKGMAFYNPAEELTDVERIPFAFALPADSLRVALPYGLVGGNEVDPDSGDPIDAPSLSLAVTLLTPDDEVHDTLPGSGDPRPIN